MGLEMVSISISYLWPNLGIICWKCFHGLPLGSFMKNLTFSIVVLLQFSGFVLFFRLQGRQPQMPPDHRLQAFFRDARPLSRNLVPDHHRRSHRQSRGLMRITLVFIPGLGNDLHVNLVFLAQPGHNLMDTLSGQAAGIVDKKPDFQQGPSPLKSYFLATFAIRARTCSGGR